MLVTDGGFTPGGAFRPLAWFDSRHVERLFRAEVLRMLLGKKLITEAVVDNLLSWRHSGFSAHGWCGWRTARAPCASAGT